MAKGRRPGQIAGALWPVLAAVAFLSSCATTSLFVSEPRPSPGLDRSRWVLRWQDEFDGAALDVTKWEYSAPREGSQSTSVKGTVRLDGLGHLVLSTRLKDGLVETSSIDSLGKFEWRYGYFECRAKAGSTDEVSEFFRLRPAIGVASKGPKAEIDIFDIVAPKSEIVSHNLTWGSGILGSRRAGPGRPGGVRVPSLSGAFHTFGLEWGPDRCVFYIDGVPSWSYSGSVTSSPAYMILGMECDAKGARAVKASPGFHDEFVVDYVRVYTPLTGQYE